MNDKIPDGIFVLLLVDRTPGAEWSRKYTYWPKKNGTMPAKLKDQIEFWSKNKSWSTGARKEHQVEVTCKYFDLRDR